MSACKYKPFVNILEISVAEMYGVFVFVFAPPRPIKMRADTVRSGRLFAGGGHALPKHNCI